MIMETIFESKYDEDSTFEFLLPFSGVLNTSKVLK
jgi:hypothetical protein